jgi:3-hydroxyisobutyrate dehydrogenase
MMTDARRNSMDKIGLIGAGLMGKGIAKNLLQSGRSLLVHKRVIDEADRVIKDLRSWGAEITSSLQKIFGEVEVLLTCLPSSIEVEEILLGRRGLFSSPNVKVKTVIDFTTAKPSSSRTVEAALKEKGIGFMDSPMTGGPQQADQGELHLAVGGNEESFKEYEPLFKIIAKDIIYAGSTGSGNVLKLANNFLGLTNRCNTAAVCHLVEKMGIPRKKLYEFISVSGGYSRGFESQMKSIENNFPLSFALKLSLKDMRYAQELFDSQKMEYTILNELTSLFQEAADAGYADEDAATIYRYLKQRLAVS